MRHTSAVHGLVFMTAVFWESKLEASKTSLLVAGRGDGCLLVLDPSLAILAAALNSVSGATVLARTLQDHLSNFIDPLVRTSSIIEATACTSVSNLSVS